MQKSLPARPSLEQLKKLAKDLVKDHAAKNPEALKLIREFFPALSGKTEQEIGASPFQLHDAQSVIARQHGFPGWKGLQAHVEALQPQTGAPVPPPDVTEKLATVLKACELLDYELFRSVMSPEMKAAITKERFETVNERMSPYMKSEYQLTYMGAVNRANRPVHFWRLWVEGWESDLLVRMILNNSGQISGLLYSDPFDTAISAKK